MGGRETYAEQLVLLEGLTGNVEGQVVRIYYALEELEPAGQELGDVVSNEHTLDKELDVVQALLLGGEDTRRGLKKKNSFFYEETFPFSFPRTLAGTKRRALNSTSPSALKWVQVMGARWSVFAKSL